MKKQNTKYWTTPHGTKYEFIDAENGYVRVHVPFHMNLNRLLMFEEFCETTGEVFEFLVKEAIWEKMDTSIRDANVDQIGKYIKEQYLEKWDSKAHKIQSNRLQDPVN
jgi:hypothetical protein